MGRKGGGLLDIQIRLARPIRDAPAVADIYRVAVERSVASFESVPPDASEMSRRIRAVLRRAPWLVASEHGQVVGYAYAAPHRERPAYRWSVDVSAYVREGHRGRGVGRALYEALIPALREDGYVNVYAGITLPNPASVALHEAVGMQRIGVYRGVGWKMGAWRDVAWYGMRLAEPVTDDDGQPLEPGLRPVRT
jgi:L-amino acid N-acyltransferase YncA